MGTVPVVVVGGALLVLLALLAVFFLLSLFLVLWTGGIMPALMQMVMTSATDSPRSTKSSRGRSPQIREEAKAVIHWPKYTNKSDSAVSVQVCFRIY